MESNRYKISSTLWFFKLVMILLVIYSGYSIFQILNADRTSFKELAPYVVSLLIGVVGFWLFSRVAEFEYNDIEKILYIRRRAGGGFEEIPLRSIEQITLSPISPGNGQSAYTIRYRDQSGNYKAVLFFPKLFTRYSRMIKEDTQAENPEVYIRNWTIGS